MLALLSLLITLNSTPALAAPDLAPGDVLLQPLQCWSCSLIEEEESSIYSHVGIVLSVHPTVQVAEALGKVRALPLAEFTARTEPGQSVRILRLRDADVLHAAVTPPNRMAEIFRSEFDGLNYDPQFLWNNQDDSNRELIYCSELIAKLLDRAWGVQLPLKRMHFDRNAELWRRFFKGSPPAGEWGISPADLERSELFQTIGELGPVSRGAPNPKTTERRS
jgi:hypothetical protein